MILRRTICVAVVVMNKSAMSFAMLVESTTESLNVVATPTVRVLVTPFSFLHYCRLVIT